MTNARTGTRFTLIEYGDDTLSLRTSRKRRQRCQTFRSTCTNAGSKSSRLCGRGRYWIDGAWYEIVAGERISHEPGNRHIHPINSSEEPLEMVQTVKALSSDPEESGIPYVLFSPLNDTPRGG